MAKALGIPIVTAINKRAQNLKVAFIQPFTFVNTLVGKQQYGALFGVNYRLHTSPQSVSHGSPVIATAFDRVVLRFGGVGLCDAVLIFNLFCGRGWGRRFLSLRECVNTNEQACQNQQQVFFHDVSLHLLQYFRSEVMVS